MHGATIKIILVLFIPCNTLCLILLQTQLLVHTKHIYIYIYILHIYSLLHVSAADRHHQGATPKTYVLKPDEATTCVSV